MEMISEVESCEMERASLEQQNNVKGDEVHSLEQELASLQ